MPQNQPSTGATEPVITTITLGQLAKNAPSTQIYDKTTRLVAAAAKGDEDTVKLLLDEGVGVDARSGLVGIGDNLAVGHQREDSLFIKGRTALQAAAGGGHGSIVGLLLDANADPNAKPSCDGGRTALQAAAEGGHEAVVELLLDHGADIDAEAAEKDGKTALQAAAGGGYESVVRMLLDAGADIDTEPAGRDGGMSSLAATGEAEQEVRLQLGTGLSITQPLFDRGGRTALQAAAAAGHESVVKLLLDAGAGACGVGMALQEAAGGGHGSVVKLLLKTGADINAEPSSNRGRTILQAAAEGGHKSVVKMLLGRGADVNAKPSAFDGRTALQAAAGGGHEAVVELLLDACANVNAKPSLSRGRTALQAAAGGGHELVVKLLLKAGANTNADPSPNHGRTALQAAAEGGHYLVVKMLLNAGANINAEPLSNSGRTPLQAAAEWGHNLVVKILLDHGANVNEKPSALNGRTALQAAAGGGHEPVVELLLEAGAEVNAKPSENRGKTALQAAAEGGHESVVKLLLDANAEVNAEPLPNSGRTPLQAASGGGYESIVGVLLNAGANVNAKASTLNGRTALQAAAEGGHELVVKLLLSAGANVRAEPSSSSERTALQAAVEKGYTSVVELLLNAGADVKTEPLSNSGRTLLQTAAEEGYESVVVLLLAAGAEVNAEPLSRTPLQMAAERGHEFVVKMLLSAGAEVDAKPPTPNGRTALQAAAGGGHDSVVGLLLGAGAMIGDTLHIACASGSKATARTLYSHGAKLLEKDLFGRIPLHHASAYGHLDIVQWLISLNSTAQHIDFQDYEGQTPLHLAIDADAQTVVDFLLRNNAKVEVFDNEYRKPLHLALKMESDKLVKMLLKNGASGRDFIVDDWRTILPVNESDGLLMKESRGSHSITIEKFTTKNMFKSFDFQKMKRLASSSDRYLYSVPHVKGTDIDYFPMAKCSSRPATSTCLSRLEWMWSAVDLNPGLGAKPKWRPGVPSIGNIIGPREAFISCSALFVFLMKTSGDCNLGTTTVEHFQTVERESRISWVMIAARTDASTDQDTSSKSSVDQKSRVNIHTIEYRSTLNNGWIPEHSVEFFTLFITDLHEKWRGLLEAAQEHQANNYERLLKGKGKTSDLIEILLKDAQEWGRFRALLTSHERIARGLPGQYGEKNLLYEEIKSWEQEKGSEAADKGKSAIDNLSAIIKKMYEECDKEIKELERKTKDMIELEFNLVSIFEVQRSTSMAASMKRLSWITFIFLPLMFVASLFGMNLDVLKENPPWPWYFVIAGPIIILVLAVWLVFKYNQIENLSENLFENFLKKIKSTYEGEWKLPRRKNKDDMRDIEARAAAVPDVGFLRSKTLAWAVDEEPITAPNFKLKRFFGKPKMI